MYNDDAMYNELADLANRAGEMEDVLAPIIAIVKEWQAQGRSGYCMPVLGGEALEKVELYIVRTES